MTYINRNFSAALACGTVIALLCMPANALDVGAGASVGGSGGVSAGVGASTGGGGGTSASGTVGVGGGNGANASANVGTGGATGTNANVDVSLGGAGNNAATATAAVNALNAIGIDASVGIGTGTTTTPGVAAPGTVPGAIARMSTKELLAYKKTCKQVLGNRGGFDANLVALCKMVQMASR
jgi:hypothetical protein